VTYEENETEHQLFEPNNLLAVVKIFIYNNLVVLVVILLLGGENFPVREEDVFVPLLGVPLEKTLCSFPSEQE
jgi:hypothetical protein